MWGLGGVCVGDWEGDGMGGIYRDENVFSVIIFMLVSLKLFIFDKNGRLTLNFQKKRRSPIWNLIKKNPTL